MDWTQILIIFVVVVLTAVLTVIGIQVFYILKEVRESMRKVNLMLDNARQISDSFTKPVVSISNSLGGLTGLASLLGIFFRKKKGEEEADES